MILLLDVDEVILNNFLKIHKINRCELTLKPAKALSNGTLPDQAF
jgi:hypothetical protein